MPNCALFVKSLEDVEVLIMIGSDIGRSAESLGGGVAFANAQGVCCSCPALLYALKGCEVSSRGVYWSVAVAKHLT